jgi:hypothetical protein
MALVSELGADVVNHAIRLEANPLTGDLLMLILDGADPLASARSLVEFDAAGSFERVIATRAELLADTGAATLQNQGAALGTDGLTTIYVLTAEDNEACLGVPTGDLPSATVGAAAIWR